jgi:hypothetical protein
VVKLAASQELYSYWNLLRGQRSAPERAEIDPGAIRGILADTFILEADSANRYPLRVAGTRTNALFLTELRGQTFLDLWQAADQPEIATLLSGVTDDAAAVLAGAATGPRGLRALELEILLLPLRHHGNTHARVLGACTPASVPSWMGLLPAAPMKLLSFRMLGRVENQLPAKDAREPEEWLGAADFARPRQPKRRGHLFVLTSARPPQ